MLQHLDESAAIGFEPSVPISKQLTLIAEQEAELLRSENFLKIAKIAFLQMLQEPELAKSLGANKVGCMSYLEVFLKDAIDAGQLNIEDVELAAKQFVYQLKSFIFYPHLYGFDVLDEQQETYVIEQSVAMFLARYGR